MDCGFWTGMVKFLLLWTAAKSADIPNGVYRTECHHRYFMIAVDLSFTGQEPYFEAVDRTGVIPITEQYAARCGYTISVLPVPGTIELRASYFSCHTTNNNDNLFTFNFNLVAKRDGQAVSYVLNETCSPSLPWSPREVTCELNYLEVSVKSDVVCPLGPNQNDWDAAMQTVHGSATSGWQVVFEKQGTYMKPMNLSEASLKGYTFDVTEDRIVFRAAYGQPHSFTTMIDGVPVEVVRAILFSRQSWLVLLIDLVAACTMYKAEYSDGGNLIWKTPDGLYTGLHTTNISFGLNGKLLPPTVAKEKGYSIKNYSIKTYNTRVQIGIPYNAEGAYRKSFVDGDLFDLFTLYFYMEQMTADKDGTETRIRFHRTLSSPLLKRVIFTENRTVPEEKMFTVYLSNVPEDVEMVGLRLNQNEYKAPFINSSSYTVEIHVHPNKTYGYTLKVPYDDPSVIKQFSQENEAMENKLNIVYILTVRPKSKPYYHRTSVSAFTRVSPPMFDASCSEKGISFKLDHKPSDVLWEFTVGSNPLTSELAAKQGYIMNNNSQTLQLDVPLFAQGYKYENISLKGFLGTFETHVRDHKTSEVQSLTAKTCPFTAREIVVCSTDGRMTVVADLSKVVARGESTNKTTLWDKYCGPTEADESRALFSFPLNSCGTRVKLKKEYVIYENEIIFRKNSTSESLIFDTSSVIVQCTYPLAGLYRLFSVYRFESESPGIGHLLHTSDYIPGLLAIRLPSSTLKPTTTLTIAERTTMRPILVQQAYRPSVQYVKVARYFKNMHKRATNSRNYTI